ncbi:MAG: cytochrome C [Bacteroidetes bacterium]|nr:MAG: cytochrome C [Bacteroidota bacterium]
MKTNHAKVTLFIDDVSDPIAVLSTPVEFELDTHKLTDGQHVLKIISKSADGPEGIRCIPFTVRNGPAIDIAGIKENTTVDGILPLMINSYDKGSQETFRLEGSETPQSIPNWLWIILISFLAWACFYFIQSFT